ncbi:MAG TPA: hypothetical protein VEQ66_16155 [Propionibacteriaceae bacterium]|nr:hypothetical protein [Propionibacteriaceae bacterium]
MSRPSGDDRDAVDRAFADLVAGFHLTADRSDPLSHQQRAEATTVNTDALSVNDQLSPVNEQPGADEPMMPDGGWADEHPLFRFDESARADREPRASRAEERFVPEPPLPLTRPAWPVLVAWLAMGYAVLAVLATALGLDLPMWAAWVGLVGFVGGFGLLVARLPRHRPPDAGDGAVL